MAGSGTAGEQKFTFRPFTISCAAARLRGTVTPPTSLQSAITFQGCATEDRFGNGEVSLKTTFDHPVEMSADNYALGTDFELTEPDASMMAAL